MSDQKQTPLIDLLRRVPPDARAIYEHYATSHSNIPYGRLCNEAAAEITRLREQLAAAKERFAAAEKDAERWRFGVKHGNFPRKHLPETTNGQVTWTIIINNRAFQFDTENEAIDAARKGE